MNKRERESMALMKNIYDAYFELPLCERLKLNGTKLDSLIGKIPPQLKEFKQEIRDEISIGVEVSGINKRFADGNRRT